MRYDGQGRRISKTVDNGNRGTTENVCERLFWVCQDANWNVLGVLSPTGRICERYEYTSYGQRTVFSHGWIIADFDGGGSVNGEDLTSFTAYYTNSTPASPGDLDGSGAVDGDDLIPQRYLRHGGMQQRSVLT